MLTDGQWAALEPLIEARRPAAKLAPKDLCQTMGAILWRHKSRAKWRAVPEVLWPWWKAAQTLTRWSKSSVWKPLLILAQKGCVELSKTFLGGTNIRAHKKAAGAPREKTRQHNAMIVRQWADCVAAPDQGLRDRRRRG